MSSAYVVHISMTIIKFILVLVNNPVSAIQNVFIEVLHAWFKVNCHEPLVSEGIKLHIVFDLPVIEGAAKLDTFVARSSVLNGKSLWLLVVSSGIEGGHDFVDFH